MKFPKLKNPLLCRVVPYIIILGTFAALFTIIACIKPVSDIVKLLLFLLLLIGLLAYLFKNFAVLMGMDVMLSMFYYIKKARKQFDLPQNFSSKCAEERIKRFGKRYPPLSVKPCPSTLQYKHISPITVYTSGIEEVVAVYHTPFLEKEGCRVILNSAKANSQALKGKKRALFLDKEQKKAPLNRVTVAIIYAEKIDECLRSELFDLLSKQQDDGVDIAFLPCVIDLQNNTCIFDSLCLPTIISHTPVKNRGIKIIKKLVFGGKLPIKNNEHKFEPKEEINENKTLWEFWRETKKEMTLDDKKIQKRYESMKDGEIIVEDDYLYLKWGERGIWLLVELDVEHKVAKVDELKYLYYPKSTEIDKKTIGKIKQYIADYYAKSGYTAKFN